MGRDNLLDLSSLPVFPEGLVSIHASIEPRELSYLKDCEGHKEVKD